MVGTGDIPANDGTEAGQPPNLPTPSSAAKCFPCSLRATRRAGRTARRTVRLVGPLAGLRCIIERRQHLLFHAHQDHSRFLASELLLLTASGRRLNSHGPHSARRQRRSRRPTLPTPVGAAPVDPARRLLRDGATAPASVAELSGLHGGHVDVGTTGGQYESPLPKLIGDLRRAYGEVTVRIREYRSETDVATAVRDGTVELGFGFLEPADSGEPTDRRDLDPHNLGTDELCVALPREIAEGLPDPLPFDQIHDLPVIAVTGGALGRVAVESALRRASRRTTLGVVTAHRQASVPLVAAGAGMAWVPRAVVDNAGESGVVARAMDPPLILPVGVMYRPGVLSPAARALLAAALWRRNQQDRARQHRCGRVQRPPARALIRWILFVIPAGQWATNVSAAGCWACLRAPNIVRRCSSMAEHQLPKLNTRVRFPSSAPRGVHPIEPVGFTY